MCFCWLLTIWVCRLWKMLPDWLCWTKRIIGVFLQGPEHCPQNVFFSILLFFNKYIEFIVFCNLYFLLHGCTKSKLWKLLFLAEKKLKFYLTVVKLQLLKSSFMRKVVEWIASRFDVLLCVHHGSKEKCQLKPVHQICSCLRFQNLLTLWGRDDKGSWVNCSPPLSNKNI